MVVNKVEANGETLIDLTSDSVTPETLAEGETAHDAQGEKIVGKLNLNAYQTKTDENLETKSKELVGAINELSNGIVGNTWVLYDDLERANSFTREFKFTSNGREFDAMQGILRQDDTIGEYFVLNYRLASDGRYVQAYYGWSGIGWQNTKYQTIFTEDTSVHLSHIGVKKATTVDELLKTGAKTIAGAINEIFARADVNAGYIEPETGEWYEDMEYTLPIPKTPFTIFVDIGDQEVYIKLLGATIFKLSDLVGNKLDPLWGDITGFLGKSGDFATAVVNKIEDFFTKEKIDSLETEQKIIPLAVNEVNTKVKDVVEGRRKTVASTSDKLAQARKITFTGDVSGEVSFDGSKDESVNITVLNGGKIANLTNTSFTWNDTPNLSTTGIYNVDFTVEGTNYSKIAISQTYIGGQGLVNIITYDGITVYNEKSGWVDNKYKDVKFTGGTDATNTTLITMLKSNGNLQKEQIDPSNLATVDKIEVLTLNEGAYINTYGDECGLSWEQTFGIYDEDDNLLKGGTVIQTAPIVAGENITFELDEENQVVKINATDDLVGTWILNYDLNLTSAINVDVDFTSYDADGVKREFKRIVISVRMGDYGVEDYGVQYETEDGEGFIVCDTLDVVWYNDMSRSITITTQPKDEEFITWLEANAIKDDPYIKKIKVILNGSEMVTDIINKMLGAGYELGQFAIFEFSGANSGTYGFTINHYGGNIYNIGGIDFGTFYTMANNVTDWSTVSMWPFFSRFQPPIPYCDESNEGQVLKVVGGVPTWTTP